MELQKNLGIQHRSVFESKAESDIKFIWQVQAERDVLHTFVFPILHNKAFSLLPQDDYAASAVKLCTFIDEDDSILLQVNTSYLLFDRFGFPLKLSI